MKIRIKYIQVLLLTVIITGCSDDFLDRQPLDEITTGSFYNTEQDAQQALVAVYDVLQYQSVGAWAPPGLTSDVLSDDSFAGGADVNDGFNEDEFNNFRISTTNPLPQSIWLKNYIGIFRANLLLEKLPEITASDEFKARTVAELKFLRAYFHFEQVRYFENIPLLTATIKGPSEFSQTQNTPAEVYNQIALDLVDAIDALPEVLQSNELGRITKWAAESLLARVYLFYNGVYGAELDAGGVTVDRNAVLLYLEDVITSSGHALLADYADIFRLASEYSSESVFEIGHGDNPVWWDWGYTRGGEGNLGAQMQGPRAKSSNLYDRGWSYGTVSNKIVTALAGDPRLAATVLTETEILSEFGAGIDIGYQHTGNFSKKYSSDVEHWGSGGQFELNRTCNYRVIRYSDVLLMAAELGSANAQQYLDEVRDRVSLPSVPVTLDNIYKERQLEFALEGLRYYDVIRRGMAYATQELTVIGDRGPNYVDDQLVFDVTFDPATRGFLPIPQLEVDLSGGVFIQNDGY